MNAGQIRWTLLALFLLSSPVSAAKRVALVIGNSDYLHATALANPLNDASGVSEALVRLGFAVSTLSNASKQAMEQGLQAFSVTALNAEIATVFYAGHGIEVDRQNYLVPVDAKLERDVDIQFETVPLELVLSALEDASGLRLVILDACRQNPFVSNMRRAGSTRTIGRGLARVEPTGETLVAYAAKEGTVAADGDGRNSPYTEALLRHIEEPDLELGMMFRKVRDSVRASTGGSQVPFVYGSLSSDGVYLGPRDIDGATGGATPPDNVEDPPVTAAERVTTEIVFWRTIRESRNPADFEAYLKTFGEDGSFALLAHNRLAELNATDSASANSAAAVQAEAPVSTPTTPGRVFRDCDVCPEMVVVPAGRFMMGDSEWEDVPWDWDGPQHQVSIRRPFAVGVYEVTRAEFGHFVDDTGYVTTAELDERWGCTHVYGGDSHRQFDWRGPGYDQADDHPVVCVGWHDARSYVAWLTKRTGETYRLLSESEWEYVAHGGSHLGRLREIASDECAHENFDPDEACDDGYTWTAPVGSFTKNGYGLYDVLGNVMEWVEDCWNGNYLGAPDDGSAWNQGECGRRIPRGGYWNARGFSHGFGITGREGAGWIGDGGDGYSFTGIRVARTLDS